ncbi:hypothetical protein FRC11_011422, partial [Ceratobasidium sp. 423]
GYGEGVAREIPRDPERLKEYIEKTTNVLQVEQQRAKLFCWEDHVVCTGSNWTLGDTFIEWTYVIDFDNLVFTVNGAVHFPFDNMPPLDSSDSELGLVEYLESCERIEIPAKYLTTVDLRPAPNFNVTQAQQQYDEFRPTIVSLSGWGTPTWDSLSVSQRLGTSIVKTLVDDYSDELALAQYSSVWHKIGLFCWQVANAAAPSHLICPPIDATPQNSVLYVRTDLVKQPRSVTRTIHYHMGGKGTPGQYCWFRGCLITFCPRLDEPIYTMHHVAEMVHRLRSHGRTSGVGIIMTGWHISAVAVDGSEVRHSPVLELHDGKELKDGKLLLTHLLSPTFTVSKTPWRTELSIATQRYNVSSTLPDDVLRQIAHFSDLETYISLHLVSRHIRSICLAHPRVGHHILLSYEANANSEPLFRVRSTSSTYTSLATLTRTKMSIAVPGPIWRFRSKHYSKCVLNPGLAGTFQYHQSGIGPLDTGIGKEKNSKAPQYYAQRLLFRDMIKKDKHHDMRIQTVDGVWEMVIGVPATAELREESDGGFGLYERMTGFDTSDFQEMSEAEKCHYLSDEMSN